MKLRVKKIGISTGGPIIALLNVDDAEKHDLHHEDRIRVQCKSRAIFAIVDIANSEKTLPKNWIGLFDEAVAELCAKSGEEVTASICEKPKSLPFIKKKLDGKTLTYEELFQIVSDIVDDKLDDIETTFFVSACYMNGLTLNETTELTKALVNTGETLQLKSKRVFDLHCIGGVPGNRTTLIAVPIIAATGLVIPKTSSRAITSPAGAADTMEVLANVKLPLDQLKRVVDRCNGCIVWGGAINLAPADDKIIRIEHPLSIDAEGQLLASVLGKKFSVGATDVLIDIPVGPTVKARDTADARRLARKFKEIGKRLGMDVLIMFSDGARPVGRGIGPALEARDCLWVLKNDRRQPMDLRQKSVEMAAILLEKGGKAKPGDGKRLANELLLTGQAYRKMLEIIKAQGAKKVDVNDIELGQFTVQIRAMKPGRIAAINNIEISKIARIAGAPKDAKAGIYLEADLDDFVRKGSLLYTIYCQNKEKLAHVKSYTTMQSGFKIE